MIRLLFKPWFCALLFCGVWIENELPIGWARRCGFCWNIPISRDFRARAAYKVSSISIEDSDEKIVENITLPSIFLQRSWSHCVGLMSTMLREGKQTVTRQPRYFFWEMWKIWRCKVLVRLCWNEDESKKTFYGPFEGNNPHIRYVSSSELIVMAEWRP